MIKGLHHVGFEVDDLEESIKYYERIGFNLVARFKYEEADFLGAMLKAKNFGGVELFKFNNHEHEMVEKVKHHTAFETDNIEADLAKFLKNGYEISIPLRKGKTVKRYVYLKDRHGNYLEILEP